MFGFKPRIIDVAPAFAITKPGDTIVIQAPGNQNKNERAEIKKLTEWAVKNSVKIIVILKPFVLSGVIKSCDKDSKEPFILRQVKEPTVSVAEAYTALDNMDDYARMGVGVDARGPRLTLERFIAERAADNFSEK